MTLRTRLTSMFDLSSPIVLAPMGGVSGGRLAAAVAAAGGLGLVGGGYGDREWLARELALAAAAAGGSWGAGLITWSIRPGVMELVLAHRESLGEPSAVPVEVPGLLDDPDHDLRAIARFLTTPVQSGVFVSRRDIAGLGRRIDVPVGFGSRARMLEHVWRGAGEYGAVGALIDELIALLDARGYQELDDRLAPWIAPWALKLSATRAALSRMREAGCRELDQRSASSSASRASAVGAIANVSVP